MTHSRFDDVVKTLAGGTSRRSVVKTLIGGAGAAAITAVGLRQEASADAEKPNGSRCVHAHQCRTECCIAGVCRQKARCA